MIKPKKICAKCHKIKNDDCDRCKKKPFEGISHENQSFYNSSHWRKVSKNYKKRNPLCHWCLKEGKTSASEYTDHIIPIRQGGDKWNESNFQALCSKCHAIKSAKDAHKYK